MRYILDRCPLLWKCITVMMAIIVTWAVGGAVFLRRIADAVAIDRTSEFMLNDWWLPFFVCSLVSVAWIAGLYLDIRYGLSRINHRFKYAIAKKRLALTVDELKSNDMFQQLSKSINIMLSMAKQFDQMKSLRISTETTSIKVLMNTIREGVIFVDHDNVITHINHHAEGLFRLVPGEVVGETIVRCITNPTILSHLDCVLTDDCKITDVPIDVRPDHTVSMTILPIKNKTGGVVRVMIIFRDGLGS